MDDPAKFWHLSDMDDATSPIPAWQLYGETRAFPDICHVERIADRAMGLDWRIAPHRHLHLHQVFLLMSGRISLSVDGADLPVTPPMVVNIPPGVVHGFRFSAGTDGHVVTLPVAQFDAVLGPASETGAAAARSFAALADDPLCDLFDRLADTHRATGPYRRTRLMAEVSLILCAALARAPGPPVAATDPRLAAFQALRDRHLRDGWGVAAYSRALGLSPRHLGRLCHAATGLSPQAMIDAHRMREACRLLAYTRMSVAQVGFALGWADPSYFSRSFARTLGLSPKGYRAQFDGGGVTAPA
jgi:AraC family transcriptional regulator, transcriptional activator of pobA